MKKVGMLLFPLVTILFVTSICILFAIRQSNGSTISLNENIANKQGESGHLVDNRLLNINKATAEELSHLPGIGETLGNRIVAYRKSNGHFSNPQELLNVKGITQSLLDAILPYIAIA